MSEVIAKSAGNALGAGVTLSMEALKPLLKPTSSGTLKSAAAFVPRRTGMPNVRTMGDTFHMNLENAPLADAILEYGHTLVETCTSRIPTSGARVSGHIDFEGRSLPGARRRRLRRVLLVRSVRDRARGQPLSGKAAKRRNAEMERGIPYMRGLSALEFDAC
jgi:hypothetical protein